ncbi:hypothetical protein MTR67_022606 [Solanum verrucosum]|uniref:Tf2-1-like SH3-like domain-containing protein n=1 Tax=Solanum verrucosum TaxID=315347 RepID=A0AAF0QTN9_SOLVR|nr:hypothetical protein MTR67_022606 [Solanum verrucosum]
MGKLRPRYIFLFEIHDVVGPVAYRLAFFPNLSRIHPVFHVLILEMYHGNVDYMIKWNSIVLNKELYYEEERIVILDRDVLKLRKKEIKLVKVLWRHCPIKEATWETRMTYERSTLACLGFSFRPTPRQGAEQGENLSSLEFPRGLIRVWCHMSFLWPVEVSTERRWVRGTRPLKVGSQV